MKRAMREPIEISRRLVVGGGSLFGLLFLTGCQGSGGTASADLPGPVAPSPPTPSPGPMLPPITQRSAPNLPRADAAPTGVLPRSAWTNAGVARASDINPMNGVERITIHHDGMSPFTSPAQADAARRIEMIRASHVKGSSQNSPFADIGYHYIIDPAGRVWEGRSTRYQGAHVSQNNEHNLGIMCLGNYDLQRPSQATLTTLDRFVASQMRRYNVPLARVKTHREINPTACPGANLQSYMVATRSRGGGLRLACAELDVRIA
jgi:hypothetical protein